jgi:alkylation response protein AidB-like acyl-CoA dehydrogenase
MKHSLNRKINTRLEFSDEQAMVLESAKAFCRDNSNIEQVRVLLQSENLPDHTGFDRALWNASVELGWLGLGIPEEYGGSDIGIGSSVAIAEAMGRYLLSTPFQSCTLAAQMILRGATEQQKKEWLPQIASGAIVTPALLDNEDWGAQASSCTAVQKGDAWVLSGSKILVCDATTAKAFIVAFQTPEGMPALAIINADQLSKKAVQPHILLDETKRAATVDFSGVTISMTAVFDLINTQGCLRDTMLIGALLTAAEAVGTTSASLDTTVEYMKTRKQFGKLIGSYQALKHPAVDILCKMDSAKTLAYHAATLLCANALSEDAEIACRMAKVKATDALLFASDRGIQFHGAMGFTYECDAQLYIRRAQWSQQQFGDAGFHRKRLASLLLDS